MMIHFYDKFDRGSLIFILKLSVMFLWYNFNLKLIRKPLYCVSQLVFFYFWAAQARVVSCRLLCNIYVHFHEIGPRILM